MMRTMGKRNSRKEEFTTAPWIAAAAAVLMFLELRGALPQPQPPLAPHTPVAHTILVTSDASGK